MSHTPGPWIIHTSKCTFAIQSSTEPHAGLIAHVYAKGDLSADQSGYSNPEESEANAKLIAAAPDMLAALRSLHVFASGLVERMGMDGDDILTDDEHAKWQAAAGDANVAIAKAEGQS